MEGKRAEIAAFVEPIHAKVTGQLAPLTVDGITGVQGPLITWLRPGGDTIVMLESQVVAINKDAEANSTLPLRTHDGTKIEMLKLFGTIDFVALVDWAVGKTFGTVWDAWVKDAASAQQTIDHALAVRYVIVIRILEYVGAQVLMNDTQKFTPGRIVAEARVLDIKGNDHGGFRFTATNSDKVTLYGGTIDELATNLSTNISTAFDQGLQKLVPGSSKLDDFVMLHDR